MLNFRLKPDKPKKPVPQQVNDICELALVDVGFKRPRKGTRYWEFSEQWLGWVGLNQGNHHDYIKINPFIGVHCVPLTKLWRKIEGQRYQKGNYATIAIHLGEICPDVDTFLFFKNKPGKWRKEAKRLAKTIKKHGLPYMEAHTSYEAILPILEQHVPMMGGYPERVILTHYLMGNVDTAKSLTLERLTQYKNGETSFEHFAKNFGEPFLKFLDEKQKTK